MGTIPVCYALHVLTLGHLYAVTFAAGFLSVMFNVANGTLFVSIVDPDQYVDGQSLIYGSRAFSFVAGPSIGGMLVQALTAPVAIAGDALSFLGSAFFLSRIRPAEPAAAERTDVTGGLRFIVGSPVVRASLVASATINFFNLMFAALFTLYAVRALHVRPGMLGAILGAGAVGSVIGALLTKRLAARIGVGSAYLAGGLGFTVPLVLIPLAPGGNRALVLAMLFVAEFASGFGVMMLDISAGSIFAAVIPDTLRSRVTGAFQAINYGTRPAGALLGGFLGTALGLRPALWIAVVGAVAGALLILPSRLPGFRIPS
jgi:predicted MFS family arabinose efflux permease